MYRYIYTNREDQDWEFQFMLGIDVEPAGGIDGLVADHFGGEGMVEGIHYLVCEHPYSDRMVDILEVEGDIIEWAMRNRVRLLQIEWEQAVEGMQGETSRWFRRLSDTEYQIWRDGCVPTNHVVV